MSSRKPFLFILTSILLVTTLFLLWPTDSADAQCGSQASSCKNCHEVQAEYPVNNDGTGWHESHAFGDFCEFCHAGNVQAPEKEAAHTGLVAPLDDVKAGCSTCHVDDLMEKANVYAATLGVEVGTGGSSSGSSTSGSSGDSTAVASASEPVAPSAVTFSTEIDVNDPNIIDYAQRYDEIVLGHHPTNWGNVALMLLIGAVVVGGGAFVAKNENWLSVTEGEMTAVSNEYPTEIVNLLPQIAQLSPDGHKRSKQLLGKSAEASPTIPKHFQP
ncbi:MAG: hypothetical protein H6669_00885 [Ardenticatenaceae bacterium]|nr:hypothetical protein [Ardenticatenaceae bacterium]